MRHRLLSACVIIVSGAATGAQPVLTIPPDPFPSQSYLDANPGATLIIIELRDWKNQLPNLIDYNGSSILVDGTFWTNYSTTHKNGIFEVRGQMGTEGFGSVFDNCDITIESGSLEEVFASNASDIVLKGGGIFEDFELSDNSSILVLGGRFTPDNIASLYESSSFIMQGGSINEFTFFRGDLTSRVEIHGGIISSPLVIRDIGEVVVTGGRWFNPCCPDTTSIMSESLRVDGSCLAIDGVRVPISDQDIYFDSVSIPTNPFTAVLRDGNPIKIGYVGKSFTFRFNSTPCLADFDCNSLLNFFDFSIFLNLFDNADARSDINNDGQINFFDVSEYVNIYISGCPD